MTDDTSNPFVSFDSINVNAIETNAGIFIGTNSIPFWSSRSNTKSGLGTVQGSMIFILRNVNIVKDDDLIDTPMVSSSIQGWHPTTQN